jgi:hypothetical protein
MVKVNEKYEIVVYPADWNSIVTQYNSDRKAGKDTILRRQIAGMDVECMVTGYSWNGMKKPNAPQKQKIMVLITDIIEEKAGANN